MVARIATRLPSPYENRHEESDTAVAANHVHATPSSLRTAVRMVPESKILSTQEQQDLCVAIEVEGALHERKRPVISMVL